MSEDTSDVEPSVDDTVTPEVEDATSDESDVFDPERAKAKIAKANSEAAALRKRLKVAQAAEAKLKEIEDASKSELERERELRQSVETELKSERMAKARLEVASDKGVPSNAIKFLSGETREELEASADEIIELVGASAGAPSPNLRENLRPAGRGTPDDTEALDPGQLADRIYQKVR